MVLNSWSSGLWSCQHSGSGSTSHSDVFMNNLRFTEVKCYPWEPRQTCGSAKRQFPNTFLHSLLLWYRMSTCWSESHRTDLRTNGKDNLQEIATAKTATLLEYNRTQARLKWDEIQGSLQKYKQQIFSLKSGHSWHRPGHWRTGCHLHKWDDEFLFDALVHYETKIPPWLPHCQNAQKTSKWAPHTSSGKTSSKWP